MDITWRNLGECSWPVHPQTGRHPLPPGCGAECDGAMEKHLMAALMRHGDAMTVGELVAALRAQGVKARDESVRQCIGHLQRGHLVPILSSARRGVWLATSRADFQAVKRELKSRIAEISARIDALDEVEAITCDRDLAPLARRWEDGAPAMEQADYRERARRARVDEIRRERVAAPEAPDALEAAVSAAAEEALA